jgi:protein SCO1/2
MIARRRMPLFVAAALVLVIGTASGDDARGGNAPAAGPANPRPDRMEPVPPQVQGVTIEQRHGEKVRADVAFRDQDNRPVTIAEFLDKGRPIILTFNYSNCPMLCHLQLNGLVDGLKELAWTPGQEFEIVSVIMDPLETPARAKSTQQRYVNRYGRSGAAAGWHFLTGSEGNIRAVADSVGYKYRYEPNRREYLHSAALVLLTPDGRVARYHLGDGNNGSVYGAQSLRLALTEAAAGEIGGPMDRALFNDLLMWCFHYDEKAGRYSLAAMRLVQAGGFVTLLIVAGGLALLWRREFRNRATAPVSAAPDAQARAPAAAPGARAGSGDDRAANAG